MKEIDRDWGNWFAGFTDGEGSFLINKRYRNNPCGDYQCRFAIQLRDDDRVILEEIHETLGLGTLYDRPANTRGGHNCQPSTMFHVATINDCAELVKVFDKYPLRAKKKRDFDIWKTAVGEVQKPIDERDAELLEYCYQEIREVRKYGRREVLVIPKKIELQLSIEFADALELH